MIDEDAVVRTEGSVVLAVDDQLGAADYHDGVAAGGETVDDFAGGSFGFFGRRDRGAIAVGDAGSHKITGSLDVTEEEVVGGGTRQDR